MVWRRAQKPGFTPARAEEELVSAARSIEIIQIIQSLMEAKSHDGRKER